VRSVLALLARLIVTPVIFIAANVATQSPAWGVVATSIWWVGGAFTESLVHGRVDAGRALQAPAHNEKRLSG